MNYHLISLKLSLIVFGNNIDFSAVNINQLTKGVFILIGLILFCKFKIVDICDLILRF